MSVREKNDLYYVRIQVGGKRIERAVGRDATKEDAKALEATIRREILDGKLGKAPKKSLDDALLRWLMEVPPGQVDPSLKSKIRAVRKYTQGRSLAEIVDVAGEVQAAGLAEGLSVATINRRLALLRRVANLAHDVWGWLDRPLGKKIKTLPGEVPRYVQIDQEQAQQLIADCPIRSRDAVLLAALTGLREGELLRFNPALHLKADRIVLDAKTKTRRPRVVPLTKQALALVKRWRTGAVTYAVLRSDFEAARKAAGMPWLQFRDLRRTFGSWIVQQTGSLKAAQDLLGHTTPTVTSRHYVHLLDDHLVAAVETLPAIKTGKKRGKR